MQRTSFSEFACSAARALDQVGEWWTPLIIRDVFLGLRRFDLIQRNLGIPRKVLTERLATLVDAEILQRVPYRNGRMRHEYALTEKGQDFLTTLVALMGWGDRWISGLEAAPLRITHAGCGGAVETALICRVCGARPDVAGLNAVPGPGAKAIRGTAIVGGATPGRQVRTDEIIDEIDLSRGLP